MDPFLQRFRNQFTTAAALLACVVGIYHHHLPPGTCSLGGTEGLEVSPTSIQNGRVEASFRAGLVGQEVACLLWVQLGLMSCCQGRKRIYQGRRDDAGPAGQCASG
jgi:hypothetical protein